MPRKSTSHGFSELDHDPKLDSVSPDLLRLFQARNEWDRLYQLSNLLKEAQIDLPDFFDSPHVWSTICREPNPEKLAWRLSQEIGRRTGGKVPPSLLPYIDRNDFEEEERAKDQSQFEIELSQWLKKETALTEPTNPKKELRIVWKIVPGMNPLENKVNIEFRANSPKIKESARNFFQIRSLCHDLVHRPELFSREDALLIRWLSDYFPQLLTDKNRHGSPFLTDNSSLLIWLQQWGQTGRCRFEDGKPVEFSPLPARIVPQLNSDLATNNRQQDQTIIRMGFEIATAAGICGPLSEAHLFLAPKADSSRLELELVYSNGCFYRLVERPPLSLLNLTLKNHSMRFEPTQTRHFLPLLLQKFPSLQTHVKIHLREIPAEPHFYFFLDEDDALQIRLLAKAKQGSQQWEWSYCGWTKLARPPVSPHDGANPLEPPEIHADQPSLFNHEDLLEGESDAREIWDEIPAECDCATAQEWLRSWNGEPGEICGRPDEPGWWHILNGKQLPAFVKLWKERSHNWKYFGNKRFENLIFGRKQPFPKIKIVSSGVDWFTVKTEWEEESKRLTLADWQKLRHSEDPYVKLNNGDWMSREEANELGKVVNALADLGISTDNPGTDQTISALQLTETSPESWQYLASSEGELGIELQKLQKSLDSFTGIPATPIPQQLKATLRPYQHEGFSFLVYSGRLKLGAILADDMGLGKTIQTLCWLQHLQETEGSSPSLVVCPASVVFNWIREAAQFTPNLKVLALAAGEARHELRQDIPNHDLILTNYSLLRRDLAALKKFSFRAIVLDEAQNIKNPDSMVAKAAKVLTSQYRLALTGTPLENRLLDLWSIIEFINPGYLPPRSQFNEQYSRGALPQSRSLLSARLRPVILRRLKRQVAKDLPDRIEERIDCELTEGQRKLYLTELQRAQKTLNEMDPALGSSRIHALAALTRLRQICCHPTLVDGKRSLGSGKTSVFLETLEPLYAAGHKVLVFSQFVEMLKILEEELKERNRLTYLLTGQTKNRGDIVEAFQKDTRPSVFLLSLKAAGTGLNLTSASYVILYDPWWNPAVEAQAIDRTHRIGQDRTVIAYRLVTQGTVEEKIWQLQQRKSKLVSDILGEEDFNGNLTKEDLKFLLEPVSDSALIAQ